MLRIASANFGYTTTVQPFATTETRTATGIAYYNPPTPEGQSNGVPLIFLSSEEDVFFGDHQNFVSILTTTGIQLSTDYGAITGVAAYEKFVVVSTKTGVVFGSINQANSQVDNTFVYKKFNTNPKGVFVASDGSLFVVDGLTKDVFRLNPNLPSVNAQFNVQNANFQRQNIEHLVSPTAVAYDTTARAMYVVVSDGTTGREGTRVVKVVGTSQKIIGQGSKNGLCRDGAANTATFGRVTGITVDKRGGVFMVDVECNTVRFIDKDGYVTTVAGDGPSTSKDVDGPGTEASFISPLRISYDAQNDILYILESGGVIRTVTLERQTFAPQYVCGEVQPARSTAWWWGQSMWDKAGGVARKHDLRQLAKDNPYKSVWQSMISLYQKYQTLTADDKVVLGSKAPHFCPVLEYRLLVETVVQFVYENIGDGFSPGVFRETFFNTLEESTARLVSPVGNIDSVKRKVVVLDAGKRPSSEPLDGTLNGKVAFQVRGPNGMRLRDKMQFASLMKRYNLNPVQRKLIVGFFISVEREGVAVYVVRPYRVLGHDDLLTMPDYNYTCGSVGARPKGWWTHVMPVTADTTTTDVSAETKFTVSPFVTQFQSKPPGFCPNLEYRALVTSIAEFVFRQQSGSESSLGVFKDNFMIALSKTFTNNNRVPLMFQKDVVLKDLKLSVNLSSVVADLIIEDQALVLFRASGGVRLSDRRLAGSLAHLYATSPGVNGASSKSIQMGYHTAFVVVLEAEGVSVYDAVAPTVAVKQQRLRFEAGPFFRTKSTVILPTSSDADAKRLWRELEQNYPSTEQLAKLQELANNPTYNMESSTSTEQPSVAQE